MSRKRTDATSLAEQRQMTLESEARRFDEMLSLIRSGEGRVDHVIAILRYLDNPDCHFQNIEELRVELWAEEEFSWQLMFENMLSKVRSGSNLYGFKDNIRQLRRYLKSPNCHFDDVDAVWAELRELEVTLEQLYYEQLLDDLTHRRIKYVAEVSLDLRRYVTSWACHFDDPKSVLLQILRCS